MFQFVEKDFDCDSHLWKNFALHISIKIVMKETPVLFQELCILELF